MNLELFRSLWTCRFDLAAALEDVRSGLFNGVEGPVPGDAAARRTFATRLQDAGSPFIAEVVTGGGYVPNAAATAAEQREEFERKAEAALECRPRFLTAMTGSDRWPIGESVEFFGKVLEIARRLEIEVCIETHRTRPTFHPWATAALVNALPALRLTCDFSHWCCVCERLVLEEEPELLALFAGRAGHVHARVGYDQGAQVPHPAAPENRAALQAHERWWRAIWQARKGVKTITMTPEFGPDGYLQTLPFTGLPVADLDEINRWMAARLREQFAAFLLL